jgi:DNA (cytosine-5)-methyltransferase 1
VAGGEGVIRDDFAGPGGWDTALASLGHTSVGVEADPAACATGRAAGHHRELADVRSMRAVTRYRGGLDGYIASPPCQTFSAAGGGAGRAALGSLQLAVKLVGEGLHTPEVAVARVDDRELDVRSMLVLEPLHVIVRHRPQWVALEQVPQVLPVWQAYAEVLTGLGYSVATGYLQAEQYGVAQTRKRAVLMAHQDRYVHLPVTTHSKFHTRDRARLDPGVHPWVSMAAALQAAGLELPGGAIRSNYGTGGDPAARGVRTVDEPAATVTSKVDRNLWQLVQSKQANATVRDTGQPAPTIHSQRTANLHWEFAGAGATSRDTVGQVPRKPAEPAHTITGKGTAVWTPDVGPGNELPPERGRGGVRVTVAQAAVLQSFPADYPWQGTSTARYRQVGDAIPPLLARAILAGLL